jgi:hypothetical protein
MDEAREAKQLWFAAGVYLELAEGLNGDKRTHAQVIEQLASKKPEEVAAGFRAVELGAHLVSAGIRFASLEELLVTHDVLWGRAYPLDEKDKFKGPLNPDRYLHVYLRDSVAHAEPQGSHGIRRGWQDRKKALPGWLLGESLGRMKRIRDCLEKDLQAAATSWAGLGAWLTNDAEKQIRSAGCLNK